MKKIFKKHYKKIALVLSLCLFIVWGILGTGASLAWFTDVSPTLNNIFHFAEFDLEVSHRLTDGNWELVDNQTKLFDEEALYEPGYTQVIYLKVKNNGTRAFNVYTAINVNGYTTATNVFGQPFSLQDYLRFGITISSTEDQMKNSVANREIATLLANMPLHNYHTDTVKLNPNQEQFIALVVHMPKDVTNVANYRGSTIPKVELGLTVKADQIK
ncbi:MAG: hypothetical protein E7551_06255 [Ruminococcaceae bacterium]|nr:hypothetical protein [Oscillospiraceae bacterium]